MSCVTKLVSAYWCSGPLVIATAALTFSFTALIIKFIGDSIPPYETVASSGLLCLLTLTGILHYSRLPLLPGSDGNALIPESQGGLLSTTATADALAAGRASSRSFRARVALLTLLRASFGALATTSFCLSLEMLSLKDAVTLFFTSPVIALLLDWAVAGRSPGCGVAAATALTLAGALLVTQLPFLFRGGAGHDTAGQAPGLNPGPDSGGPGGSGPGPDGAGAGARALSPVGVALALVAAGSNASGFLAVNLLRGRQPPLVLTWWYNLVLVAATSAPLAVGWPLPPKLPSPHGALLLAAVGATQLAAQLCLNRGFQLESAGRGAAINVLQVLFSFILDVAVLGDTPSLLSVAGSSLVAAGVLFVALSGGKGPEAAAAAAAAARPGPAGGGGGGADAAGAEPVQSRSPVGQTLEGCGVGCDAVQDTVVVIATVGGVAPGAAAAAKDCDDLAEPLLGEENIWDG